jgi:16S rRNA (guanine527-N7)-methyltransferase
MFHVKHQGWAEAASAVGASLSATQIESLHVFEHLLVDVAVPRGMVSAGDVERLWPRHILDSLRGAAEIAPHSRVADVGSGAGLPGVPLAVALPLARFVLIEPRRARAAFLETVAADLRLTNADVRLSRAERIQDRFDLVVSRAVAPAADTWALAEPLLEPAGRLMYWAGREFDEASMETVNTSYRLSTHPDLAEAGPLVIMTRQ